MGFFDFLSGGSGEMGPPMAPDSGGAGGGLGSILGGVGDLAGLSNPVGMLGSLLGGGGSTEVSQNVNTNSSSSLLLNLVNNTGQGTTEFDNSAGISNTPTASGSSSTGGEPLTGGYSYSASAGVIDGVPFASTSGGKKSSTDNGIFSPWVGGFVGLSAIGGGIWYMASKKKKKKGKK